MGNIYVKEDYVNLTRNGLIGSSDIYESYTDDIGELYRAMQQEYGRCVSKVYVDGPQGGVPVGWVFHKRMKYDDCNETYLREVWVTTYQAPPDVEKTYHYQRVDNGQEFVVKR